MRLRLFIKSAARLLLLLLLHCANAIRENLHNSSTREKTLSTTKLQNCATGSFQLVSSFCTLQLWYS
ncbi:hypothetical protein PR003_g13495 [Phytophthora rubi]|uniref:RxLR effector protein n=1 Tax=Phytophthora rubi TaxID=129364 RepID=A0A6A3KWS6_9STRA|nr:hypothetical protein PR002_g21485 [Phytophthora rubi]KAE9007954.1 hypothetical protein PR001_g16841 [Phytophthora rubi]KAE9334476.1 hypothetical protein PR003_g13495 [Phytophthora rubi]